MTDHSESSLRSIDRYRVAPPFDGSLAALDLRHKSNAKLEDGYDLTLSASLSPQVILLLAGQTEIEVLCEITEAEVHVTSQNTKIVEGTDYIEITQARKALWTTTTAIDQSSSEKFTKGLMLNSGGPSGNLSSTDEHNFRHQSRGFYDPGFYHSKLETLRISFKDGRVLDGPILEGYSGWIAKPENVAAPSGVRLDLIVREPWLRFKKIDTQSSGSFANKLRKMWTNENYDGSEKRNLFVDLLRKLTIHGLPARNNREAILDSVGRILMPGENETQAREQSISGPRTLEINEELLTKFVDADAADARAVYLAISKALEATVLPLPLKPKVNSKNYGPTGTIFAAIEALEKLNSAHQSEEYDIDELQAQIGTNTYRDLSVFGFFQVKRKLRKVSFQNFGGSAEVALFRSLAKGNWFEFAEAIIIENVRISTADLGETLSESFGLKWSRGTKRRHGQNIKKWVINLSPSLLSPDEDHPDYFYISSFKRRAPIKGATPIITLEMAKIFEVEKTMRGVPYKDTAKRFGVSSGSYQNFRNREPEIAEKADQHARSLNPDLFNQ